MKTRVIVLGVLFCFIQLFAIEKVSLTQILKPDAFLKTWLISDPLPVPSDSTNEDMSRQQIFFEKDHFPATEIIASTQSDSFVGTETSFKWHLIHSEKDIIDLIKQLGDHAYVYSYAFTEIESSSDSTILFGLGSDDAVKMWVNGELVHSNFEGRPVTSDQDLVPAKIKNGKNTILLKIHNMQGDWGFSLRPLGEETLPDMLITSAALGQLDRLNLLIDQGADVNSTIGPGLTPLHVAIIRGRTQTIEWLKNHGADETVKLPSKEALVNYMVGRAIKENYPGAAVLIARDGEILYQRGFGLADTDEGTSIMPMTTFRIGSITKQFTAAAILILQEQGKLSVNDTLSHYFPDFPQGNQVTLHHLLTHTSGIHSFTSTPEFMDKVGGATTKEDMLEWISSFDYDFDPGESFLYNNSGYYLLGLIIEKVNGKSYAETLHDFFFDPLGMENTGVYGRGLDLPHEALGYQYENGEITPALDWNMDFAGGAGNLYSNVLDLHRWNEALFSGGVLSEASLKAAFTPVTLNNGDTSSALGGGYGYGWAINKYRGLKLIQHGGGLDGFNSILARAKSHNLNIVVLSNALPNLPNLNPGGMAMQLAELYLYENMNPQESMTTVDVDADVLDDYVGRYDYQSAVLTVRRQDDQLLAQLTGQPEFKIFPQSDKKFYWKIVDAQIEFVRNEKGEVTHGLHTQNGATLKVARLEDVQTVEVDETTLATYVGDYEITPEVIMSITQKGDQLYAQVTGQPVLEIHPSAENVFFYKVVNAKVTFNVAEDGTVTSLTLEQGPVRREAKKIK